MGCGTMEREKEREKQGHRRGRTGFAGAGKRMKRRPRRESPRYSLDDLCGSDAISEASLESGLSPGTPVLVNHRDPPTPVPCSARSQAPARRCDMTINEVKRGTERLPTELLQARDWEEAGYRSDNSFLSRPIPLSL